MNLFIEIYKRNLAYVCKNMSTRGNVSHIIQEWEAYLVSGFEHAAAIPDILTPGYTNGLHAVIRKVPYFSFVEARAIRM